MNSPLENFVLAALVQRAAGCVALARYDGPLWDCPGCLALHRAAEVNTLEVAGADVRVCRRTGSVVRDADEHLAF